MSEISTQQNRSKSRNRIVAFVDILGASQAALSGQSEDLVGKIFRLGRAMKWTHNIHRRNVDETCEKQVFRPGIAQFSDCLLLWSDPLDGLSPDQFIRTSGSFLWNLSAEMGRLLLADVPFRAGVSEGPVFISPERNVYAGRPIVEAAKLEACQEWLGAAMLFEDRPDRIIRRSDQIYLAGDRSIFESFVVPEIQVPLKKDCPSFLLEKPILAINWTLSSQEPGGPTYADFQTKLQELQSRAESKAQIKYDKAMQLLSAAIKIAPQNMLH